MMTLQYGIHLLYNLHNTVIYFSRYLYGISTIYLIFIHLLHLYQKGVYYFDVNMFNMLSSYIKIESDNCKKFKLILHKF